MTHLAFETGETAFSLVNSLACARAALLAYSETEAVETTAAQWGFERVRTFPKGPNHGIVLGRPDLIVVAFRGTDGWADWATNLNLLFRRSPLGLVHRGFMRAAESFWPELGRHVSEIRDRDQSIWVTGHSLGGSLAVLGATKLFFDDRLPIAGLVTFGQPPVATSSFCSRFAEQCPFRLYRFVNHTDAVSDVPILFRSHFGEVRYFDTEGTLRHGEPPWKVMLSDRVRAPRKYGGLSQFQAHGMKDYVDLIAAEGERLRGRP